MSLLDDGLILIERADFAVNAWATDYANDFISNIRFMGAVDSLPKLTEGMMGEVYLLKCNDNLETYIVTSKNSGQLGWMLLNSTEV